MGSGTGVGVVNGADVEGGAADVLVAGAAVVLVAGGSHSAPCATSYVVTENRQKTDGQGDRRTDRRMKRCNSAMINKQAWERHDT